MCTHIMMATTKSREHLPSQEETVLTQHWNAKLPSTTAQVEAL